jgi:2-polyprenyl-6-methoxyphenol hydroxylase-like FAD-dependent oxidoreductase
VVADGELCDVAIVGCGPVGQTLAILLGQRGWRVRVFERFPAPYPLPRAVHFDHEIGRVLQAAGVAAALAGRTEPASVYEWRNAAGEVLLRIGRDARRSLSGWPESNMFHQPELERILDERARALPAVRVERGCEVRAVRDAGGHVELDVAPAGGEPFVARARFAVGCDGANSLVRHALGAAWSDLGFRFDWLVVDVVPDERRDWDPLNWQLCDPARPTTIVSGGPGRRRFEFMRLPHETIAELDDPATAWRLLEPWGLDPGNARLERHAVYTFRACWAERWRCGRLLLAGDAAHLMPPFAGQGLCAGLRDAVNLAWKLDLSLAGRAGDALLDSYPSERIPHARAVIELSIALGRLICTADPAEAKARDARMAAEAHERQAPIEAQLPPLGPGCLAAGSPAAGELFVQDRVARDGVEGLFDDVVGSGFALVSPYGDPAAQLDAGLAAFFASLGGRSAHVGAGGPLADVGGGYERWFRARGAAVALQRPDFHVFGTAPTLSGVTALVAELRERITR